MSTAHSPKKADTPVPSRQPVALIAGPTASGKSDLAVSLAKAIEARGKRAVVINADSQQVYADLRILSARPNDEEMGGIEHRLFGTWDGAHACSAAEWADAAKREIADLHADNAIPILVGGTGLYFRTLLEGIAPIPDIDPEIRREVRAMPKHKLRCRIEDEDPKAAVKINAQDQQRMARALEVVRSTGKTLTEWQKEKVGGIEDQIDLHPLIILPDRDWLYDRCDRRFERMLKNGALQEVADLLKRNLDPALPVMRAIGVPELGGYLDRSLTSTDLFWGMHRKPIPIKDGQAATRQYAKRQYTWFRNQPSPWWPRIENINVSVEEIFVSLFHKLS